MPSANYQTILGAIQNRQQIIAYYEGYYREMCPHAIGYKAGVEQALFFQFGGSTSRGPITSDTGHNWRCLTIGKLSQVSARKGPWHTFNNHSEHSECIDRVMCEVT